MLVARISQLTKNSEQIFTLRLERLGYSFTKRETGIAFILQIAHKTISWRRHGKKLL